MTTHLQLSRLRQEATAHLAHSASASLDADILLSFVLHKSRSHLHAWPERTATPAQSAHYRDLVHRRAMGEPVAYITGQQEFWSMGLQVTNDTLVPRPETELLVEQTLQRIPSDAAWKIADLGTGSGAIALAIAQERPQCTILATDLYENTLNVANQNAARLQKNNIRFLQANWCNSLASQSQDLIVSNPPYIAEQDPHLQGAGVRYEPKQALASGPDGLLDIRKIVAQAWRVLRPSSWLVLEHGYTQASLVATLLTQAGYQDVCSYEDYAGNPRVTAARKSS